MLISLNTKKNLLQKILKIHTLLLNTKIRFDRK